MNDENAKALGMRAKVLPGSSWQPRMMNGRTGLYAVAVLDEEGLGTMVLWEPDSWSGFKDEWDGFRDEDWPDFRDPPTMGWLMHQAQEACGEHVEMWLDTSCGWKVTRYPSGAAVTLDDNGEGGYTSEIGAWIAVLEDAAKRGCQTPSPINPKE